MSVLFYKLRNSRQPQFLTGYAEEVLVDEGRILLKGRRIPWTGFADGFPVQSAQLLGDLELPADSWAAWAFPEAAPSWWGEITPAKQAPPA